MDEMKKGQRLHKVLAQAGIASRRKAESLIAEGRVKVDGKIVTEMGMIVDPHKQDVRFDDEKIRMERPAYYLVYKPKDVLCTTADGWGRKTIIDMLGDRVHARLFSVGRLELESEGLVLLTNDGDFAQRCLHPRRGLDRTYYVKLRGSVSRETIDKARAGVWLSDGKTAPMEVQVQRIGRDVSTFRCTLVERQHRELRRLWARLGHPVERMVLVAIGPVGTQELKKGRWRSLTDEEVRALRDGLPRRIRSGKMPRGAKDAPMGVEVAPASWGDDDDVVAAPRSRPRPERASAPKGPAGPRRGAGRAPGTKSGPPRGKSGFGAPKAPGRGAPRPSAWSGDDRGWGGDAPTRAPRREGPGGFAPRGRPERPAFGGPSRGAGAGGFSPRPSRGGDDRPAFGGGRSPRGRDGGPGFGGGRAPRGREDGPGFGGGRPPRAGGRPPRGDGPSRPPRGGGRPGRGPGR